VFFKRTEEQDIRGALRICEVDGDTAFFHAWMSQDYAIVEYLDGTVALVHPESIRFIDF
jgi:hypothetical protein